jgi:ornithine--oxo-acid transaminase
MNLHVKGRFDEATGAAIGTEVAGSDEASDAIRAERRYAATNYAPLPVVIARGRGVWLWDTDGRRYLDMMSAYSAVSHGHRHPRIVAAAMRQLHRVGITSRAYHSDVMGPFLAELCRLAGLDRALPMNTGAEAVETAIKAARRYAHRTRKLEEGSAEIIVADGNFHGRTTTIISFSSEPDYRAGFGPFTPGFVSVPFGDADAAAAAINPRTAAILIEPIQGEAGIRVPRPGYLKALREICDQSDVLLILDEVQSGLGRTGRLFCFEHEGIRPDGITVGKALGGGLVPVSAFVARRELMDVFDPGSHGSTFGGYPLAAAVGLEALQTLVDERLAERSARLGPVLAQALKDVKHRAIREVRGLGLWQGVELDPALADARKVCEAMVRRGVLSKETHHTVLRFAPPLVISEKEIRFGVDLFADALDEICPAGSTRRRKPSKPARDSAASAVEPAAGAAPVLAFAGWCGDRTEGSMRGAALLAQRCGARLGREAHRIGNPAALVDMPWRAALERARPYLGDAAAAVSTHAGARISFLNRCATSLATLPRVFARHPEAALVWCDAHGDYNTPETTVSGYIGGMVVAGLCGRWDTGFGAGMSPDRVALVGARDLDPAEAKLIAADGVALHRGAGQSLDVAAIVAGTGARPIVLHIDCDVVDPQHVPSEYRVPDGLHPATLRRLAEALAATGRLVALEVAEFEAPDDASEAEFFADVVLAMIEPALRGLRRA